MKSKENISIFEVPRLSSETVSSNVCPFSNEGYLSARHNSTFFDTTRLVDLKRILKHCYQEHIKVFIYSGGQSWIHKSIQEGAYICYRDTQVHIIRGDQPRVKVGNAVKLRELEIFLNQNQFSLPVLTSYLSVAVGGVLSVGGYGQSSCLHGSIVNQVTEVEAILLNGEHVKLTPKDHLFRAILGGGGEIGCILSATLNLTSLYKRQKINVYEVECTKDIVRLTDVLIDNGDFQKIRYYKGGHFKSKYSLTFGHDIIKADAKNDYKPVSTKFIKYFRVNVLTEYWHQKGIFREQYFSKGKHLWQDYVIPYRNAFKFAAYLDAEVHTNAAYYSCNGVTLILAQRSNVARSNCLLSPCGSADEMYMGFGIYMSVLEDSPGLFDACYTIHTKLVALCQVLEGKPYLAGNYPFSEEEKTIFFGESYKKFLACRKYSSLC